MYESRYIGNANKFKILVFHDSFFNGMSKFFKESFGETVFVWSDLQFGLVEKEKPDILIYERVERDIDMLLNLKK